MLYAKGEKGMFASGPELTLEILPPESLEKEETSIVRINVSKGKKTVSVVFGQNTLASNNVSDSIYSCYLCS